MIGTAIFDEMICPLTGITLEDGQVFFEVRVPDPLPKSQRIFIGFRLHGSDGKQVATYPSYVLNLDDYDEDVAGMSMDVAMTISVRNAI